MNKNYFEKIKKAAVSSLSAPGKSAAALPKSGAAKGPKLYVFRHTETYDNKRRIFSGRRQSRLTEEGLRQAKSLSLKIKGKKIDLFVTPPLVRCRETLKRVAKFFPKAKIETEKLLLERDYGTLTGRSKLKIMRENPDKAILWRRSFLTPPPKGESLKEVQEKRVFPFCRKLEKKMRKEKINAAVCATNNTMRLIRMYFEKLPVEQMLVLENPFGDYAEYDIGLDAGRLKGKMET